MPCHAMGAAAALTDNHKPGGPVIRSGVIMSGGCGRPLSTGPLAGLWLGGAQVGCDRHVWVFGLSKRKQWCSTRTLLCTRIEGYPERQKDIHSVPGGTDEGSRCGFQEEEEEGALDINETDP